VTATISDARRQRSRSWPHLDTRATRGRVLHTGRSSGGGEVTATTRRVVISSAFGTNTPASSSLNNHGQMAPDGVQIADEGSAQRSRWGGLCRGRASLPLANVPASDRHLLGMYDLEEKFAKLGRARPNTVPFESGPSIQSWNNVGGTFDEAEFRASLLRAGKGKTARKLTSQVFFSGFQRAAVFVPAAPLCSLTQAKRKTRPREKSARGVRVGVPRGAGWGRQRGLFPVKPARVLHARQSGCGRDVIGTWRLGRAEVHRTGSLSRTISNVHSRGNAKLPAFCEPIERVRDLSGSSSPSVRALPNPVGGCQIRRFGQRQGTLGAARVVMNGFGRGRVDLRRRKGWLARAANKGYLGRGGLGPMGCPRSAQRAARHGRFSSAACAERFSSHGGAVPGHVVVIAMDAGWAGDRPGRGRNGWTVFRCRWSTCRGSSTSRRTDEAWPWTCGAREPVGCCLGD